MPNWDTRRARELYDQGLSWSAIGRGVGVSKSAVLSYGRRPTNGWPRRAGEQEFVPRTPAPPSASPVRRGQSTLPPLRSDVTDVP